MKKVTMFIFMFLSFSVFATEYKGHDVPSSIPSVTGWQQQGQEQLQGQGQGQLQQATGGNSTNTNSVNNSNKVNSNVNVSSGKQWPSSFISGYAGYSQYNCANAFGASGGYGSLLIPWESGTCKIFWLADKMFSKGRDIAACNLLKQVSQFQDMLKETGLTCNELFGELKVQIVKPIEKVYPISEKLKKKYPEIQ
jgi:hypothetical protein